MQKTLLPEQLHKRKGNKNNKFQNKTTTQQKCKGNNYTKKITTIGITAMCS